MLTQTFWILDVINLDQSIWSTDLRDIYIITFYIYIFQYIDSTISSTNANISSCCLQPILDSTINTFVDYTLILDFLA